MTAAQAEEIKGATGWQSIPKWFTVNQEAQVLYWCEVSKYQESHANGIRYFNDEASLNNYIDEVNASDDLFVIGWGIFN